MSTRARSKKRLRHGGFRHRNNGKRELTWREEGPSQGPSREKGVEEAPVRRSVDQLYTRFSKLAQRGKQSHRAEHSSEWERDSEGRKGERDLDKIGRACDTAEISLQSYWSWCILSATNSLPRTNIPFSSDSSKWPVFVPDPKETTTSLGTDPILPS